MAKKYIYTGTKGWALPRKVMALAEPIEPGEESHMTVGVPYGKTKYITIYLTRRSRDRNRAWVFTKKEWDALDEGDLERLMEMTPTFEGAEIMPMKKEVAAEMRKARLEEMARQEEEAALRAVQGVAPEEGTDEDDVDESYAYEVEGAEDDGKLFSAVIEPRKRGRKLGSTNPTAGRPAGSKNKKGHNAGGARRNSGRKRKAHLYEGEPRQVPLRATDVTIGQVKELRSLGVEFDYAFELWTDDYYRRVKECEDPAERPDF